MSGLTPPSSIALPKGGNVALTHQGEGARSVVVGLGWQLAAAGSAPLELDAQAILVGPDGTAASKDDVVFFSRLSAAAGSHRGPRGSDHDDVEQIVVDLDAVPASITRIVLSVAIYAAAPRRQSFAQVHRAFIRVADAGGVDLARHELTRGTGAETAMVFGELYRHRSEWKLRAVGQGYTGGLAAVVRELGVDV